MKTLTVIFIIIHVQGRFLDGRRSQLDPHVSTKYFGKSSRRGSDRILRAQSMEHRANLPVQVSKPGVLLNKIRRKNRTR